MTKYEREIYNIILSSHDHLTPSDIYDRLVKVYPGVVQATVYNNLIKLCESGLIRKVAVEGIQDRYDTVQKHDHLICRKCGRIMDISLEDLTLPLRRQLGEDFISYDLKVFYICPECRKCPDADSG